MLGPDAGNCGHSDEGACGKCLLVSNPSAVNSDWKAIIMKKNRCPPWSNGCGNGQAHFDLAVPGYDNLQYSTANCCGSKPNTISKSQSSVCGTWYYNGSSTIQGCTGCDQLPGGTLQNGCKLFTAWGWTRGDPQLNYEVVTCPATFVNIIASSFNAGGVTSNDANEYLQ